MQLKAQTSRRAARSWRSSGQCVLGVPGQAAWQEYWFACPALPSPCYMTGKGFGPFLPGSARDSPPCSILSLFKGGKLLGLCPSASRDWVGGGPVVPFCGAARGAES